MEKVKQLAIAGVAVLAWSVATGAIERGKLPVFTVTDVAGGGVSSTQLTRAGHWLLIYVRPGCQPCDAVLRSVDLDSDPGLPSRIAVVVLAGDSGEVERTVQRFPSLAAASWYGDAAAGAAALGVTNAPAVFGMSGGIIEWSVAGVLSDATDIKAIMVNWVR